MSLTEKIAFVNLAAGSGYENKNAGIARLCIPSLTLQDGPDGLAYDDRGVSQLPASLATAATFNVQLARQYGRVLGTEAHGQGIDVVQAPDLNLDRDPQNGRAFEGFGEDPYLASELGSAEIQGIQSAHVMAEAKHFTGYNQEAGRLTLNQVIPERALQEVYLAPFRAAVKSAHVAALMCAYGQIDSVDTCANRTLFSELENAWGFTGFIRSDLSAVTDPVGAFAAGLDLIKPTAASTLSTAVTTGVLSTSRLDDAVHRILTEMFAYGMIRHPLTGYARRYVRTGFGSSIALKDAEQSIVLLKNSRSILPLSPRARNSIAVIGTDAAGGAMTIGGGSSAVKAPFTSTPLAAMEGTFGRRGSVTFASASPTGPITHLFGPLDVVAEADLAPPDIPPTSLRPTLSATTATSPLSGPGWVNEQVEFTPPSGGLYNLTLTGSGDSWLRLYGTNVIADHGIHSAATSSVAVSLTGGTTYVFKLSFYEIYGRPNPSVDVQPVDDAITQAVATASSAKVAVIFVNDTGSETYDQVSLSLPGYENDLIFSVARANPNTIVVLNTSEPVLMPWQRQVAGILEAWYPGEQDGTAIAAVLSGKVDPSGRLPITFPSSIKQTPARSSTTFPGVNGTVSYAEGLDIGYRFFLAKHLRPVYPFGYGLSYTRFTMSRARLSRRPGSVEVTLEVRNSGQRAGTEVIEGYLTFPAQAKEPPEQLKAFATLALSAGGVRSVTLNFPRSDFEAFLGQGWRTFAGHYTIKIGESSEVLPIHLLTVTP